MSRNPTSALFHGPQQSPEKAGFFWRGGPFEVADRVWHTALVSGVTAFETREGLVLVDTGTEAQAPKLARGLREFTQAPVHTAVYTHGHLDHAYGLPAFLLPGQSAPRVIAHSALPARSARYTRTRGYNEAINARQASGDVTKKPVRFTPPPIPPDTLYADTLTVEAGGLTFELHHARGETDDHTWVWNPEHRVLCPGDLVIWAVPNAGNPQQVQRSAWEWADALRAMAALHPRTLCSGHGAPIVDDPETVQRLLVETADYLDSIVEQTLAALNEGAPPHTDIVERVTPPSTDSPWLRPVYDEADFLVRNVIRYYGGWYSGRPSELKPAPRRDVAALVGELAGGIEALLARAALAGKAGDLRLACHLADWAVETDPADERVRAEAAAVYEARAEAEESLMAVNIYRSAAQYAREGRPFH
ncbi:alkyl sulfatase dimerization domain-containing protein [Streptomyces sp. NPDC004609]|uniref:alkyl sulfatase dimerization domain-containing protein n=1 Tax=Streptomyces sp. NPDC004609 TaxID=3364704 RepID=UPI0036A0FAD8